MKKNHQTVTTDTLETYMLNTDTNATQIANTLGLSTSCVSRWLQIRTMPKYMLAVVSGLSKTTVGNKAIIVCGASSGIETIKMLASKFDLTTSDIAL